MNTKKQDLFEEISSLSTEIISEEFANIDSMPIEDVLTSINTQDQIVPLAVKNEIPKIAEVVRQCVHAFQNNGRLIYLGAGTSGRIGTMDAAECPPTFGTSESLVQAFIAGGNKAVFQAVEGAEDNTEDGIATIRKLNITKYDVICGLSASGRTPWVLAAMQAAANRGAYTVLVTTNKAHNLLVQPAMCKQNLEKTQFPKSTTYAENTSPWNKVICVDVGPEVIAGSTRMKSATAQKLVLNMITTTAMVQIGKTYKNMMINLKPLNNKLKQRAKIIAINTNHLTNNKL